MAKKKSDKPETKTDFLRKVLGKDPLLDPAQVNRRWAKAGHPGEISTALFYQVRSKMGIKVVWEWVQNPISHAGAETIPAKATGRPKSRSNLTTGSIYQLKITLRNVQPPVWRRILVSDISLEMLHDIIQVVMGWDNSHLYSFEVGELSFTDPRGTDQLEMESTANVKLSDIISGEKFKFGYTYDFGDNWEHVILVEKISEVVKGRRYPECIDGKRACPPEDVGGPWGYVEFLEAIADPKHENHEDMSEWIGDFDPEMFDLGVVNHMLRQWS